MVDNQPLPHPGAVPHLRPTLDRAISWKWQLLHHSTASDCVTTSISVERVVDNYSCWESIKDCTVHVSNSIGLTLGSDDVCQVRTVGLMPLKRHKLDVLRV